MCLHGAVVVDGDNGCGANTRLRCSRIGVDAAADAPLEVVTSTPGTLAVGDDGETGDWLVGLSVEFMVASRPGFTTAVEAYYDIVGPPGTHTQPGGVCKVSHVLPSTGYPGELLESKSATCVLEDVTGPVALVPRFSLAVEGGIPACSESQTIGGGFDSEAIAGALGWAGRYYVNDAGQPVNPRFVDADPAVRLNAVSPSAIAARIWSCSAFYYADTGLGHSGEVLNVGEALAAAPRATVDLAFSFGIPSGNGGNDGDFGLPVNGTGLRDTGTLFIGYFHKERLFESSVWYASETLGVRILFPGTGDPVLVLSAEQRGQREYISELGVALRNDTAYRFIGSIGGPDPTMPVYVGRVFELVVEVGGDGSGWSLGPQVGTDIEIDFDGSAGDSVDESERDVAWNEQYPWAAQVDPEDGPKVLGDLVVNSFGVYHEDWSEPNRDPVTVPGVGDVDIGAGTADWVPEGEAQRCWNPFYKVLPRNLAGRSRIQAWHKRSSDRADAWAAKLAEFGDDADADADAETAWARKRQPMVTPAPTTPSPTPAPTVACTAACPAGTQQLFLFPTQELSPADTLLAEAFVDGVCDQAPFPAAGLPLTYRIRGKATEFTDASYDVEQILFTAGPGCNRLTFEQSPDGSDWYGSGDCKNVNCDDVSVTDGTGSCDPGPTEASRFIRLVDSISAVPDNFLAEIVICGRRTRPTDDDALLAGTHAFTDLIIDDVSYTIPPTEGYPKSGEVKAVATASGEAFRLESGPGLGDSVSAAGSIRESIEEVFSHSRWDTACVTENFTVPFFPHTVQELETSGYVVFDVNLDDGFYSPPLGFNCTLDFDWCSDFRSTVAAFIGVPEGSLYLVDFDQQDCIGDAVLAVHESQLNAERRCRLDRIDVTQWNARVADVGGALVVDFAVPALERCTADGAVCADFNFDLSPNASLPADSYLIMNVVVGPTSISVSEIVLNLDQTTPGPVTVNFLTAADGTSEATNPGAWTAAGSGTGVYVGGVPTTIILDAPLVFGNGNHGLAMVVTAPDTFVLINTDAGFFGGVTSIFPDAGEVHYSTFVTTVGAFIAPANQEYTGLGICALAV